MADKTLTQLGQIADGDIGDSILAYVAYGGLSYKMTASQLRTEYFDDYYSNLPAGIQENGLINIQSGVFADASVTINATTQEFGWNTSNIGFKHNIANNNSTVDIKGNGTGYKGKLALYHNAFSGTFTPGTLTANRTYTLPDGDGTLSFEPASGWVEGASNLTTQYRMTYVDSAGVLTESSNIVTDENGNLGIGSTPNYGLDYVKAEVTQNGPRIRNSADTDLWVRLQSGETASQRAYFAWVNYNNTAYEWLLGKNASSRFIVFENSSNVHRLSAYADGSSEVNAVGTNPVRINYLDSGESSANLGTGGLEVYSGTATPVLQGAMYTTSLIYGTYGRLSVSNNNTTITTDYGVNSTVDLGVKGKGTGYGTFSVYDEDDSERMLATCISGVGYLRTDGASASHLFLQNTAHANVYAFASASSGETPDLRIYGYAADDALRSVSISVGKSAADTATFNGVSNYFFDGTVLINTPTALTTGDKLSVNGQGTFAGNLVLPKTSGAGIKVDTATPTFGYRDILGDITVKGGANTPTWTTFRTNIMAYQFDTVNDEVWITFHIPHDYVPGTELYIHSHWGLDTADSTNSITWGFDATFAGRNDTAPIAFPATTNKTISHNCATVNVPQYGHVVSEVQLTDGLGQLGGNTIGVDGLVQVRAYLSADAGGIGPFLFECDLHYQSTNIATKSKDPDFYT